MATDYLFADRGLVHDVVEHLRMELRGALTSLSLDTIQSIPYDELSSGLILKFGLELPQLNLQGIRELPKGEVDIDVRHAHDRVILDRSRPHYVKGSLFRIAIPFTGSAILFKHNVSEYNQPILGSVENNRIVLSYQSLNPTEDEVRREFDSRLSRIQEMLKMVSGPVEEWNKEIVTEIRSYIQQRKENINRSQGISLGYPQEEEPNSDDRADELETLHNEYEYDVFLSHASEDKESIVRPLYEELTRRGIKVWFDEATLELGDSLRQKIDEGLRICRFGVVILSVSFFEKKWPQIELDALLARETASGDKAILPIWHNLGSDEILQYSPILASKLAADTSKGISSVSDQIEKVTSR